MINIVPYRDEHGFLRAIVPKGLELLAAFLPGEAQTLGCCDEFLTASQAVGDGDLPVWDQSGDAFDVHIAADTVLLTLQPRPELQCKLSLQDFRDAIRQWKVILER